MDFLSEFEKRNLTFSNDYGLLPIGLVVGNGPHALEVIIVQGSSGTLLNSLRQAWSDRKGNRAVPLLLLGEISSSVVLVSPDGNNPPFYPDLPFELADRLCRFALQQLDRHTALRLIKSQIYKQMSPVYKRLFQ